MSDNQQDEGHEKEYSQSDSAVLKSESGSDDDSSAERTSDSTPCVEVPPRRPWTFLIYLAGDNNLSEDMITTLRALKEVGDVNNNGDLAKRINILCCYDSVYPVTTTWYYEFNDTKLKTLFECQKHESKSNDLSGGINDGQNIVDFVQWAARGR